MQRGDLVWCVGHPKDGLQRFLGVVLGNCGDGRVRVIGCDSGTTYSFYVWELKKVNKEGEE